MKDIGRVSEANVEALRALIVLNDYGIPRPVPGATEQRLLSLLYSRAKAHKL